MDSERKRFGKVSGDARLCVGEPGAGANGYVASSFGDVVGAVGSPLTLGKFDSDLKATPPVSKPS